MSRPAVQSTVRAEAVATTRLALPLIGGQLAYVGMSFVDTVMAGRLSPQALAAVALGASVWSSAHMLLLGVLLALPPFISEYDGRGTQTARQRIAPLTRQAVWLGLALCVPIALVLADAEPWLLRLGIGPELVPTVGGYLRALCWGLPAWALYLVLRFLCEGLSHTRPTLYFGILGLGLNVVANLAFMYGYFGFPALGAVGCGYATTTVWWLQALGLAVYVGRRKHYRFLTLFSHWELPDRRLMRKLLGVGLPIAATLFLEISMFTVAALAVGTLGTVAMAGHQVALNFAALTYMVPLGVAMAVTVRVGQAVGRRDPSAIRFRILVGVSLAVACQTVSALVMILAPRVIARLYTPDPEVIAVAVQLLFFAAIFQISDGLQVSSLGALRGLKDTQIPMGLTLIAYWGVGLPVGWLLGFRADLGARGVWIGLIVGLSAAATLLALRLRRTVDTLPRTMSEPSTEERS